MLSPEVKTVLDSILPLYDARIAGDLKARIDSLAKAPAALGRLEDLVMHLGIIQGAVSPVLKRKALYLFCGDHGILDDGVAQTWPYTGRPRLQRILEGGDPISVLCRRFQVEIQVLDCGLSGPVTPGIMQMYPAPAASNITRMPALTEDETNSALMAGIQAASEAAAKHDAAGLAHIGDGGAAAAAALLAAMSGHEAAEACPRTEDELEGVHHRMVSAVRTATGRHCAECVHPFGALRCLGGWDIAAMTGFILGAARNRLPVVIDGFVPAVAALMARSLAPDSLDAAIFAHESAQPAHALVHDLLRVEPYLGLHLHPDSGCAAPLLLDLMETALRLVEETAPAAIAPHSG